MRERENGTEKGVEVKEKKLNGKDRAKGRRGIGEMKRARTKMRENG